MVCEFVMLGSVSLSRVHHIEVLSYEQFFFSETGIPKRRFLRMHAAERRVELSQGNALRERLHRLSSALLVLVWFA